MPKHRQAGFAVVRLQWGGDTGSPDLLFNGIIGVYHSVQRAEEVAAAAIQRYVDLGMDPNNPEYVCQINPTNWYDE
jgi:hypothetical protein